MKLVALLLTALLAFSATSCQKEPPPNTSMEFNAETDCQYYHIQSGNYPIAESPDGYYYINNIVDPGFLRYIDKETLQDTVLCGKPNCLHTKEDDVTQCNGFLGTGRWMNVHYYNGYIYAVVPAYNPKTFVKTYQLTKISLDGTKRKVVWELEWEDQSEFPNLHQDFIHRGKLYFSVYKSSTYEEDPMQLYSYDLKTKKCTPVLSEVQGLDYVVARGDYLFYTAYDPELDCTHGYRYTISTGGIMSFPERQRSHLYNDGIIYDKTEGITSHFRTDLDGMNEKDIELSFMSFYAANENYICISRTQFFRKESGQEISPDEYFVAFEFDTSGMTQEEQDQEWERIYLQYTVVYDKEVTIYDMNTLEELGKIEIPDGLNTIHFDGDTLIVFDGNFGEFRMIDFSKLGTDEFKWVTSSKVN